MAALSKAAKRTLRVQRAKDKDASAKDKAFSRATMAAGAVIGQQGPLRGAKVPKIGISAHLAAGTIAGIYDMVRRPSKMLPRRGVDLAVGAALGELGVWSYNNQQTLFPTG